MINMETERFTICAIDHQASDGSVVHSGVDFADAVLDALNQYSFMEASLVGLKGASSSYFNVFLRRIDEGCGLDVFQHNVTVSFDSNVQKMMYERSLESMKRGVHKPRQDNEQPGLERDESPARSWKISRFFDRLLGN
jgi:hypothetical protein